MKIKSEAHDHETLDHDHQSQDRHHETQRRNIASQDPSDKAAGSDHPSPRRRHEIWPRNLESNTRKPNSHDAIPNRPTQLADDITAAGQLNSTVLASDVDGQKTTRRSAQCEKKLVRSLRRIQTAARQEDKHSDPLKLKEYLIGGDINASRAVLEQSSLTLLALAGTERPAGLDTAFLDRVTTERADYIACGTAQPGATSEAQQERVIRQALIDSIKERRQKIQLAAEFLWPAEDPANAPTRREFDLPSIRPYLS